MGEIWVVIGGGWDRMRLDGMGWVGWEGGRMGHLLFALESLVCHLLQPLHEVKALLQLRVLLYHHLSVLLGRGGILQNLTVLNKHVRTDMHCKKKTRKTRNTYQQRLLVERVSRTSCTFSHPKTTNFKSRCSGTAGGWSGSAVEWYTSGVQVFEQSPGMRFGLQDPGLGLESHLLGAVLLL